VYLLRDAASFSAYECIVSWAIEVKGGDEKDPE
jgi:hypothetical protein